MESSKIYEKVKTKIAISEIMKEDIVMENKELNIFKRMATITGVLLTMGGLVFATSLIINKFGPNSSEGSQEAVNNGYVVYAKEDSIVDSFLIDNYNFYITFKEDKLGLTEDDIRQKYDRVEIGEKGKEYLTIKNEKDEVVFSNLTTGHGRYEENGKVYYTAAGQEIPVSKKLYVDFDGRKEMLDVPENMQSELISYKLKSISDENWKFESAALSNTAFKIYLSNCDGITHSEKNRVTTSDGKEYYKQGRNDGDGAISVDSDGIVKYYNTFTLTKFNATDDIKVHLFKANGEEVIIELERIK